MNVPGGFVIVLPMWGERYCRFFLDVALPSLMTTGNLLGFGRHNGVLFIVTSEEDSAFLVNEPRMAVLSTFLSVRIEKLATRERLLSSFKYSVMNEVHRLAIEYAQSFDAAVVFLHPDAVWSSNILETTRERILAGARAVMIPGMRVVGETFVPAFCREFNPAGRAAAPVSGRDLVRLLFDHPHPQNWTATWHNDVLTAWPSHVYFPVPQRRGVILRAFHMHPMTIWPRDWDAKLTVSFDSQYVAQAVPDVADWSLILDSDDGFGLDVLQDPWEILRYAPRPDHERYVAQWAAAHVDERERWMFRHGIFVHDDDVDQVWRDAAREIDTIADRILALATSTDVGAFPDLMQY